MASYPSFVKKYLRMTPTVKQIYEDLEEYHNFCRMQYPAVPFNEADLYRNSSPIWQKFNKTRNRVKPIHKR